MSSSINFAFLQLHCVVYVPFHFHTGLQAEYNTNGAFDGHALKKKFINVNNTKGICWLSVSWIFCSVKKAALYVIATI